MYEFQIIRAGKNRSVAIAIQLCKLVMKLFAKNETISRDIIINPIGDRKGKARIFAIIFLLCNITSTNSKNHRNIYIRLIEISGISGTLIRAIELGIKKTINIYIVVKIWNLNNWLNPGRISLFHV